MNPRIAKLAAALAFSATPPAAAEVVNLTPADINLGDTETASFSDGSLTLTPLQGGTPATFNANAVRLGIDDFGTNANAFNDPDTDPESLNEEQLRFEFTASAGLSQISYDYSRADGPGPDDGVFISGFTSDPGVSLAGAFGATTASYADGVVEIDIVTFNAEQVAINFANPAASAGQTLLLTVTDTTQAGAQFAIRGIAYEDSVATKAPVIETPLPATLAPGVGVATTLVAVLEPGTAPGPTYLWEFDDGGGFATVGTGESYSFTAGPATDGSYRLTVTNSIGSDSSTTVVTSTDDGDGIDNQWEVDNFGDFLLYGADDDVEPDGFTNAQEIAAGTDPNNADTDGDGLEDGSEGANNADPLVADTDSDGYSDGYEVNVAATAPDDPASSPAVDSGRNSIGITFASTAGSNPGTNLGPLALAGIPGYVQANWNATMALPNAALTTTETDVATPSAGTLVDSTGAATGAGFSITCSGAFSVTNNPDQPVNGLLSGYVYARSADAPTMTVDLTDIPYSRYDVVIYALGFNGGQSMRITDFANGGPEYTLLSPLLLEAGEEPVWTRSADQSTASNGTAENFPRATHVIFRGLTDNSASFDLTAVINNPGIAAIQIVEDPDSDGDGMGDFYENSVGLDPNDDGTTDPVKQGADGDFDGDGLPNLAEHDDGTDPTEADSDGDGYSDFVETDTGFFGDLESDTGTDPRIADTDGDGAPDGIETNTFVYNGPDDAGTDPLGDGDNDGDGWGDGYEAGTLVTDPFDADAPGGPNPDGFAIAFNAVIGAGDGADVEFGPMVYAGAPGVEQHNWNRTIDLLNDPLDVNGDIASINTPNFGQIVDSSGAVIGDGGTGVGLTFTGGRGAYSSAPDPLSPYGRLYNSFIYGTTQTNDPSWSPETQVTLSGIPYPSYDVYVYFGSEVNGRTGRLSSTSAGTTYSFTTQVNSGTPGSYLRTTDTADGFPQANYAVFANQSGGDFDVTTTVIQGPTLGIFGIQVVDTSGAGGAGLSLANPRKTGSLFTADFTTGTAGTFILERSQTLGNDWIQIGSPLEVDAGTTQVSDPDAPSGEAFYRVIEP